MRLRVIEPELEDHLLEVDLSSKLSTLCISQDFVSEMREAFYLFDKVFLSIISCLPAQCGNQSLLPGPERLYLL